MTEEELEKVAEKVAEKISSKHKSLLTKEVIDKLLLIGTVIASSIGVWFGSKNYDRNANIEKNQEVAVGKAEEVQKTLEDATIKQEKSLSVIEKTAAAVEDAQGPTLFLTWKRLEEEVVYAKENKLPAQVIKTLEEKMKEAETRFNEHKARQKASGKSK